MGISVRTSIASRPPLQTGNFRMRRLSDALHLQVPISIRDVAEVLEPIKLSFPLNSGTFSGACEVTITSDGVVLFSGKVHDSGALGASFIAIVSFPTLTDDTFYTPEIGHLVAQISPVVIAHRGHAGGTFSFDTRDTTWNLTGGDARIADNWLGAKAAATSAIVVFGTNNSVLDLADAFINAATGTFVFGL